MRWKKCEGERWDTTTKQALSDELWWWISWIFFSMEENFHYTKAKKHLNISLDGALGYDVASWVCIQSWEEHNKFFNLLLARALVSWVCELLDFFLPKQHVPVWVHIVERRSLDSSIDEVWAIDDCFKAFLIRFNYLALLIIHLVRIRA